MTENMIKPHWTFWLISTVFLLWNLMGAANFCMQMANPNAIAQMSDAHRAIIENRPLWATLSFGIAMLTAVLGTILLMLKRVQALSILLFSAVSTLATIIPTFRHIGNELNQPFEIFMMVFSPVIVISLLLWYARYVQRKGWLG